MNEQETEDNFLINDGPTPVENLPDLYSRILTSYGAGEQFKEINQHTATGYCDDEEIAFIRLLNSLIRTVEFIEDISDRKGQMDNIKKELRQRMGFITHSSKSYDGFGVKSVQTQRQIETQSLIQKQEEEKGMLDKLKGIQKKVPKSNKRFLPERRNTW